MSRKSETSWHLQGVLQLTATTFFHVKCGNKGWRIKTKVVTSDEDRYHVYHCDTQSNGRLSNGINRFDHKRVCVEFLNCINLLWQTDNIPGMLNYLKAVHVHNVPEPVQRIVTGLL